MFVEFALGPIWVWLFANENISTASLVGELIKEARYERFLYFIVWCVEVIVVGIGLVIGLAIAFDNFSEYTNPNAS